MNSFLKSIFDTRSMSGRDSSITIHEYTVISIPAFDSDILNEPAMSVSSPIGINSDVLNMNAEMVIPTSGSISFLVNLLFILFLFLFCIMCSYLHLIYIFVVILWVTRLCFIRFHTNKFFYFQSPATSYRKEGKQSMQFCMIILSKC